jgi:hypothetical protein
LKTKKMERIKNRKQPKDFTQDWAKRHKKWRRGKQTWRIKLESTKHRELEFHKKKNC